MPTAFVLINCDTDSEQKIIRNLFEAKEIKDVQPTIGSYDIVAKVVSPTTHELRKIISEKICKHDKIRATQVLIRTEQGRDFL